MSDVTGYWLRDPFWGALDYLGHYGLKLLPRPLASEVGRMLGVAAGRWRAPELTERAAGVLERIRPDLGLEERRRLAGLMWGHVGRSIAEMSVLARLLEGAKIELVNEAVVLAAARARRPTVFLFVHLGNWELLGGVTRRLAGKLSVIYEHLPNRFQRRIAAAARRPMGYAQCPPTPQGVRQAVDALKRGEALMLAMDEFKHGSVVSPAFGRPLSRHTNLHYALKLARRHGAQIVATRCERLAPQAFRVSYTDPIENATPEGLNALAEAWIRSRPEQWYMLHRLAL